MVCKVVVSVLVRSVLFRMEILGLHCSPSVLVCRFLPPHPFLTLSTDNYVDVTGASSFARGLMVELPLGCGVVPAMGALLNLGAGSPRKFEAPNLH